ncbi:hypothetical protein [Microbacterium sp. KRD172]|uniref:hypothetical protein n=1 Tax=Microbacterium sp. KRD172 TaxID=2729727 RepID=UPI001F492FFD
MTISEIARRTNHDRKTIRAYLNGERTPGRRERAEPDAFDAFVDYVTAKLTEDPHLWAVTIPAYPPALSIQTLSSASSSPRSAPGIGTRPTPAPCSQSSWRPSAIRRDILAREAGR